MLVLLIYIIVISLCYSIPLRLRPLNTAVHPLGSIVHQHMDCDVKLLTNSTIVNQSECSSNVIVKEEMSKKSKSRSKTKLKPRSKIVVKIRKKSKKLCKHKGCKTQPIYGIEGGKAEYCFEHKLDYMIDLKNRRCKHEGCKTRPNFGIEGGKPEYCSEHKKDGMPNLNSPKCKHEGCTIFPSRAGYCSDHYYQAYPNEPKTRNHKTKEKSVVSFLQNADCLEQYRSLLVINKRIASLGLEPDVMIRLDHIVIIIEVDENCHRDGYYANDNQREIEIHKAIGISTIFIRVNPDGYTDINNKKIKSCWGKNDNKTIKIRNEADWNHRLNILTDTIINSIDNSYTYNTNIKQTIKLFYDYDNTTNVM